MTEQLGWLKLSRANYLGRLEIYGWQDILHCMTCVMTYDILYDMGTRETTQVVSNFNLETKGVKKPFLVIMSCKME